MRLWTLHPKYLDAQGLVSLWREGLLARAVLRGATKGYRKHPQLERFRAHASPCAAVNSYLREVANEAEHRGYAFDRRKLGPGRRDVTLSVTSGQLTYEWKHLLRKLRIRSPKLYAQWRKEASPEPHPLFCVVRGAIEPWERRKRFVGADRGGKYRAPRVPGRVCARGTGRASVRGRQRSR